MDKLISVYWFLILFLAAAAVVYMVSNFYSYPIDVREVEANILTEKVADCLAYGGQINPALISEGKFDVQFKEGFLKECGLNFDTEFDGEQYYVDVEIYDSLESKDAVFFIEEGNLNLATNCEIQKDKAIEKLATCVNQRFYTVAGDKQYFIDIKSAVRKAEKNVK